MINPIRAVETPVNKTLVKYLEEMLEEAKSGEILMMAWAGVYTGQRSSNGWSGRDQIPAISLIGELEALKHEITQAEVERVRLLND